jgi:hypothetical protein
MPMRLFLGVLGLMLFIGGSAACLIVRVRFKPKDDELDGYHWEFEDRHPAYANYQRWSRLTFGAAALGLLMMFAAAAI